MESSSSNDDEEPKVCTVFASSESSGSKTVFDTIAFSTPKKETSSIFPELPPEPSESAKGQFLAESPASSLLEQQPGQISNSNTEVGGVEFISFNTASLFSQEPQQSCKSKENTQQTITNNFETDINPTTISMSIPTFDVDQHQQSILPQTQEQTYASITATASSFGNIPLPTPVDIFEEVSSTSSLEQQHQLPEVIQDFIAEDATKHLEQAIEGLSLLEEDKSLSQQGQGEGLTTSQPVLDEEVESPIPTANTLFADAPDVPFIVGPFSLTGPPEESSNLTTLFPNSAVAGAGTLEPAVVVLTNLPTTKSRNESFFQSHHHHHQNSVKPVDTFSTLTYSSIDTAYDAWIPKEDTSKILMSIATAVHAGTYFPDKSHMTTPGIIYEDDLIDKVGVNMARIFGEAEASKRRILTADNVTQDDNGLRELIKLGCYRSSINLTKRLLTLYGQGPGKVGQFSKHNPHTLQLWFTRISLLIRIREFAIAESEIDAFKEFDNPDMYYEYYPDSYGTGRKGSMVPFNFRLLAAEILQYSRKHNETIDRLTKILYTVEKILQNIEDGMSEDGSGVTIDGDRKSVSLQIWRKRELRIYYSLANASLFAKDYHNTFKYLNILCQKDKDKEPQLKSSIGRLFLQVGDLTTADKYFQLASDIRNGDTDSEQVENLVDSGMISIAQGTYPEAFALLQQALLIQPDNFMITNNMAVCLLYMGKVKEALSLMETTVKNNTPQLLQENVLLNLSTIYELENSDGHKKNSLLKLISEYKGDGINLASLKMPNLI